MKVRDTTLTRPNNLNKVALEYWKHLEPIFDGLLDEIRTNGWLLTDREFDQWGFNQLAQITTRYSENVETNKSLAYGFTVKPEQVKKALLDLEIGLTASRVLGIWALHNISVFIESTDIIRNYMRLIIRKKRPFKSRMTFGALMQAIVQICPRFGPRFAREVDVPLRNAFAHGTYWLDRARLYYVEELGDIPTAIRFIDISELSIEHYHFALCLSNLLKYKDVAGFFSKKQAL